MKKRQLLSSKYGQVTVFIVIGMILLLTVGAIIYFQYAYSEQAPVFEFSIEPVTAYVQQCLIDITEEGILLAGQNGGFIFQDEYTDEEKNLLKLLPFNSDRLLLANGKQQLKYWYYQLNDGIDRVEIPELEKQIEGDGSIQDQLEQYVEQNLPACAGNFEELEKAGKDVRITGAPEVSIVIGEAYVEITASLPLEIKEFGEFEDEESATTITQDSFSAVVPVGLRETYSLARKIAEHELDALFLEKATRNLLATYSQVDKEYLPPMAGGLHFEPCANRVFWFYNDVYDDVQQMLAANIPYLNVEGTKYSEIVIDKKKEADDEQRNFRQAVFDSFIFPLTETEENSYENLVVQFNYQTNYPMELAFGNNVGYGLIQPSTFEINILIANLCMFEYNYLYNLKYPVVVTITDPTATIDQNPLIFQFPLQVVIKNNYPRIKLNDVFRDIYRIPEAVDEPSYQCDPQQRLSGESTIKIEDAKGEPVENAVVTFQCGPAYVYEYDVNGTVSAVNKFADTCHIGITDDDGKLTTAFPPCIGSGIITVEHPDYVEKSEATGNILQGISFEKTVTLDNVYTRELSIQKYFVAPPSETNEEGIGVHIDENGEVVACNSNIEQKEFFSYESAVVTLTKLDAENGILNTAPIVVYDGAGEEPTTINVAQGEYYVDIMLMRKERYPGEMTIDANSEGIEVISTTGTETVTYPDEDVLIPQTFTGGSVFLWNVTAAELESGDKIVFSVFDEGIPTKVEQVSAPLLHREACSSLNRELVMPRIE